MPSGGNDGSFCFNHFEVDVKTTIQYEKLYIYMYIDTYTTEMQETTVSMFDYSHAYAPKKMNLKLRLFKSRLN